MAYYTVALAGANVQEAVLYTGDNRLGQIARWAKQYQEGRISVWPMRDITRERTLPTAYIVDHPKTTLGEWFGERVLE